MKYFGKDAGTASAVLGAFQCATGATVSAFAAFISMGQLLPVVILMLIASCIALAGVIYSNRQARLLLVATSSNAELSSLDVAAQSTVSSTVTSDENLMVAK